MSYFPSAGCAVPARGATCTIFTRSRKTTRCRRWSPTSVPAGRRLLRPGLQGPDALLDRRMAGEERRPSRRAVHARRGNRLRQRTWLHAAPAPERADHRLGCAAQPRRTRVGAEFAPARKPHDDHGSHYPEHDLAHHYPDVGTRPDAALGAEHRLVHDEAHDAREEKHEGIEHALDEGEGH